MQDLQDLHLAPGAVERALGWWRRFGGRQAALLVLAVSMPLIRFEYLPHTLSSAVETLAESYGVELKVKDWETSLTDIKVTAKDVEIIANGPYREKRLFSAHAVEFDWSLMRGLAGAFARVRGCWTAMFGGECRIPEEVFHKITVDGATIYMERTLAGSWNTEDAFKVKSLEALEKAVQRWQIPSIEGNDVSVSWVEQLPGDSGGGLIEHRTSTMDFTKVSLAIDDLQVPVDDRDNPSHFRFDGQTADGQVSVKGAFNLSRWAKGAWAPSSDMTYRLVNVGAATFGRFAAPDATVQPKAGRVDGIVRIGRVGDEVTVCDMKMQFRDVTYGANPRSAYYQIGGPTFVDEVGLLRVSRELSADCKVIDGRQDVRTTQALQTLMTSSALAGAPASVRTAAGFDAATVVEGRTPTRAELASQLSAQLGQKIAGEKGAVMAQALAEDDGKGGNVVSRGARGLGRGIKRLFGGGDKSSAKSPAKPATTTRKPS